MAIYHLSAQVIGRSGGRSAVAASAYRSGYATVNRETGEGHDYRKKKGIAVHGIEVPDDAPVWAKDKKELWQRVEAKEQRSNSQFAREINIALPHELSEQSQRTLTKVFAKTLAKRGLAVDWAIHKNEGNIHAHLMMTTRPFDASQPDGWATHKDRAIDKKEWLADVRTTWARMANYSLELNGCTERIDARSLIDQGIDRVPQRHQGPTATAIERRNGIPRRTKLPTAAREAKPITVTEAEIDSEASRDQRMTHVAIRKWMLAMSPAELGAEMSKIITKAKKEPNTTPEKEANRLVAFEVEAAMRAAWKEHPHRQAEAGQEKDRDRGR